MKSYFGFSFKRESQSIVFVLCKIIRGCLNEALYLIGRHSLWQFLVSLRLTDAAYWWCVRSLERAGRLFVIPTNQYWLTGTNNLKQINPNTDKGHPASIWAVASGWARNHLFADEFQQQKQCILQWRFLSTSKIMNHGLNSYSGSKGTKNIRHIDEQVHLKICLLISMSFL